MNFYLYAPLVQAWYRWGCFVALAVTIVVTFWIFYDAGRREQLATIWKVFSVVSLVAVLPSLIIWAIPSIITGGGSAAVEPLAYIGLGGGILALLSLPGYLIWIGQQVTMDPCSTCGNPLLPSWDYCPYCAQQEQVSAMQDNPSSETAGPPTASPHSPSPSYSPAPEFEESAPPLYEEQPAAGFSAPVEQKTEMLEAPQVEALAWFVILDGPHVGKEFRLGETVAIGRHPARNDIVVDDGAVSRQHAKIKLKDGVFVLHDLGSTGGTFVRKDEGDEWTEIHRHQLSDGDQIQLGRVTFGFLQVAEEPEWSKG